MTVFISYQRADEWKATSIDRQLKQLGVPTYLDLTDPGVRGSENVTKAIVSALQKSTHLLALVSQSTVVSWWVPFEIGVATERQRRIATYRLDNTVLPDYLKIWPYLSGDRQLHDFARRYFQDQSHGEKNLREFYSESVSKSFSTPQAFHQALKRDLGQA